MKYRIFPTDNFNREVKHLSRKYPSLKADLQQLRSDLELNPVLGVHLGNNIYKIRIAITSKGRGKSGGARIISYVYLQEEQIFLLTIYDKSERESIPGNEIKIFLKNLPNL